MPLIRRLFFIAVTAAIALAFLGQILQGDCPVP